MTDKVKMFYSLKGDEQVQYFIDNGTYLTPKAFRQYFKEISEKNYYYLITFTLKPGMESSSEKAEQYIKAQFTNRPALGVQEAYISKEQTKKGVDHWHVSVRTSKSLAKNRFNYYTKIYGHIDISKNKCQNLEDSINYISKQVKPEQLV